MTARAKSRSGTTRMANGNRMGMNAGSSSLPDCSSQIGSIWPVTEIAEVAMRSPTNRAPASPMNSFAGCQFNGRKPTQAPIRIAVVSEARLKYSASPTILAR